MTKQQKIGILINSVLECTNITDFDGVIWKGYCPMCYNYTEYSGYHFKKGDVMMDLIRHADDCGYKIAKELKKSEKEKESK